MHKQPFPILLLIALIGAGCAYEPVITPQIRPEPAGTAAAGQTPEQTPDQSADQTPAQPPDQPPAQPPDQAPAAVAKDLRYRLPPAQHRTLTIYIGSQSFDYVEDDLVVASGRVSTGTAEHPTPTGDFRVLSKDINKRSGKYTNYFDENTPMPYSLQFSGPYFVHEGWVPGHADSHGCVRLDYPDARLLFNRMKVGDRILVKGSGAARPANPWPDLFPLF